MFNAERRQFILDRLHRDGRVVATELSTELDVSEDTIRRDLRDMAAEGLIQRVHGGALPQSPAVVNYTARQHLASSAKRNIAQVAARLVQNGQVIILDGGTTNVLVAEHLPTDLQATVITNSPPAAVALKDHALVEVVLIGGRLYKHSLVAIGAEAIETLRMIRADLCMLGVCSLHPEVGISTQSLEEAHVKQAMIESAAEVIALVSAEKLGTAAPYIIAPLNELTHIVTEREVSEAALAPYAEQGITILQA
jgi:DeoR/GlpR family transcriptional regulator of sugar metabolism